MAIASKRRGEGEYSAESNRSREQLLWWIVGGALVAAYAGYLTAHWSPALAGGDDHGYYAQGTLLAKTGRTWFSLDSPVRFIGMHWLRLENAQFHSRYSPGMAVLVAIFSRVGGVESSLMINPLLAIITLIGTLRLVGTRLGAVWGTAAVLILAISPAFTGQALLGGSHLAVAAPLVWGTHLLFRWREAGAWWRPFVAGLLLGCIPAVRPPDAIVAIGVAALALIVVVRHERPWSHLLALGAGALVPLAPFLVYNHATFGAFWRTAYRISGEQTAFGLRYIRPHLAHQAQFLLRHGLGLFAILGAAGTIYLLRERTTRVIGIYCALVCGALIALYAAYHGAPIPSPAMSARFLLPGFPLAVFGALALVRRLTGNLRPALRWTAVGALLAVHVAWGAPTTSLLARNYVEKKRGQARIAAEVARRVPEGSVIFTTEERLEITLDVLQRWRVADRTLSLDDETNTRNETTPRRKQRAVRRATQRAARRAQRKAAERKQLAAGGEVALSAEAKRGTNDTRRARNTAAPRLTEHERRTARFVGLTRFQRDSVFASDLLRWAGERGVYFVGSASTFENVTSPWFAHERFIVLSDDTERGTGTQTVSARARPKSTGVVIARWLPPPVAP